MKRNPNPRRGLLLTPLIDIMFLLTLFFVINTSFQQESYIEVALPESTSSKSSGEGIIILTLMPNGVTMIDGKEVGMDSLTVEIEKRIKETGRSEVVIQGDKFISYQFAISVLDKVRMAGSNAVSLQTTDTIN